MKSQQRRPRPETWWCVKTPMGPKLPSTARSDRVQVQVDAAWQLGMTWKQLYKFGYRVVRLHVREG